jgi:hypothetical protein
MNEEDQETIVAMHANTVILALIVWTIAIGLLCYWQGRSDAELESLKLDRIDRVRIDRCFERDETKPPIGETNAGELKQVFEPVHRVPADEVPRLYSEVER